MDRTFRERLLGALAFIGDPSSKDLFMREKNGTDLTLALHANEGLARIADPGTLVEISRDRQQQKDPRILTAQAWALYRLGRKEFLTSVVDALGSRRTNDDAKQYLLESRPVDVPDLFTYITHADSNVREALAEIFGLLGDARAVPSLHELSRDQSGQVAAFASQALRRINRRSGS
jgi:HEAT repeat protein